MWQKLAKWSGFYLFYAVFRMVLMLCDFLKIKGSHMSTFTLFRKITDWIKDYDVLFFIGFISLGWLLSWLVFVFFALLFVK